MRFQLGRTLMVLMLFSAGLSACRAPENVSHTLSDLELLKQRVEQTHPAYNFQDLSLLNGVSQSTLDFISQRFAVEEVSDFAKLFPRLSQHFGARPRMNADGKIVIQFSTDLNGFYSHIENGGLRLSTEGLEKIAQVKVPLSVQTTLQNDYANLVQRHIHIWGDDKWEAKIYCEEECLCTSKALGDDLKKQSVFDHVLYVKVTPGRARILKNDWTYHVATLVGDSRAGWSVVDHKLFHDDELHSLGQWKTELDPEGLAEYQVSVDVRNFALGR